MKRVGRKSGEPGRPVRWPKDFLDFCGTFDQAKVPIP